MPLTSISSIKMFAAKCNLCSRHCSSAVKNRQRRNFSISLSQRETWWKSGNGTNLTLKLGHSWPLLQPLLGGKIPTVFLQGWFSQWGKLCHFTHFSARFSDSYLLQFLSLSFWKREKGKIIGDDLPRFLYGIWKLVVLSTGIVVIIWSMADTWVKWRHDENEKSFGVV